MTDAVACARQMDDRLRTDLLGPILALHDAVQAAYVRNTDAAVAAGVFGSPSYVLDGELFWGQDRLEFLELALQ